MPASIDLLILPLARLRGQDQPIVPGLYAASPPRRSARFRDKDHLALHLSLEGNDSLPINELEDLLQQLARTYYNTTGTVTSAQRAVAERLNQYLLDRNLNTPSAGRQLIGHLTQIVLREGRLALAQSGLVHAYQISASSCTHYHDLQISGNGLGLSKTTFIHHSLITPQPQDYSIIAIQPSPSWSPESLQSLRGQGPESLRRKLLAQAGANINALLLFAQAGTGRLRLLRPVKTAPSQATTIQVPIQGGGAAPAAQPPDVRERSTRRDLPQPDGISLQPSTAPSPKDSHEGTGISVSPQLDAAQQAIRPIPGRTRQPVPGRWSSPGITRLVQKMVIELSRAARKVLKGMAHLVSQVLPDQSIFTLPAGTMAFIAILVPLVVVSTSAIVYFQRGRTAQFEVYFSRAEAAAAVAVSKSDPRELRQAWQAVLAELDQAEEFQRTAASRELRQQAYAAIDQLEWITRLLFSPAIVGGLPETFRVKRLVAVEDDLYALDAETGNVLRFVFTNQGYQNDPTFECGLGPFAGYIVGALVDIAPAPRGDSDNAAIVGVDKNHILMKCIPGQPPEPAQLSPPDIAWGEPRRITVDDPDLYLLDPQAKAVWVYRRMEINRAPRLFFDLEFPNLEDVIDLAAYQNDLFLLHSNGQITKCTYSSLQTAPTRCEEPAMFTDPRPGRHNGPVIEGASFSEIRFSPPPEPSLYLLDPRAHGINLFSVRLSYALQYQPAELLPDQPASAFAISKTNRTVFLAIGNQVYYAALP